MYELTPIDIDQVYGGMVDFIFAYETLRDFRDVVIMNATQLTTTATTMAVTYALTESPMATFAGALVGYVGGYALTNGYIFPYLDQLDKQRR